MHLSNIIWLFIAKPAGIVSNANILHQVPQQVLSHLNYRPLDGMFNTQEIINSLDSAISDAEELVKITVIIQSVKTLWNSLQKRLKNNRVTEFSMPLIQALEKLEDTYLPGFKPIARRILGIITPRITEGRGGTGLSLTVTSPPLQQTSSSQLSFASSLPSLQIRN
jgi:hypothetical protein